MGSRRNEEKGEGDLDERIVELFSVQEVVCSIVCAI